jgi:ABC-type sugar transport system ATPase subunit
VITEQVNPLYICVLRNGRLIKNIRKEDTDLEEVVGFIVDSNQGRSKGTEAKTRQ